MLLTLPVRRCLHTTKTRHVIWLMTPLARFGIALGGRIARTVWRRLPNDKKQAVKDGFYKRKGVLYGFGLVSVCGGGYYYYNHIDYTPLTQRQRYITYTRKDVHQLLTSLDQTNDYISTFVNCDNILPATAPEYKLTKQILTNILSSNSWCEELATIDSWRLIVVKEDDIINAISLPTGDIIIYTGLINNCRNHDELGLIMGHEVAHIVLNHGCETLSRQGLISFLGAFVIATIWFLIPSDVISFVTHRIFNSSVKILVEYPYSQKLELEADEVGLMLASKACYDPNRSINVWKQMPDQQRYTSTHPCNEERLSMLSSLAPSAQRLYDSSSCVITGSDFMTIVTNYINKLFGQQK